MARGTARGFETEPESPMIPGILFEAGFYLLVAREFREREAEKRKRTKKKIRKKDRSERRNKRNEENKRIETRVRQVSIWESVCVATTGLCFPMNFLINYYEWSIQGIVISDESLNCRRLKC